MLLCAAWGLALAFAPRRAWMASFAVLLAMVAAARAFPLPRALAELAFLACWLDVVVTAAAAYLPGGPNAATALLLSVIAGLCGGAVLALEGNGADLARALACGATLLPAALMVRWRWPVAARVAASWLIAVAVLAAVLPWLPVTPGYLPDHLE